MPRPSRPTNNQGGPPAIAVKDCTVAYGANVVLEGISFEIAQGQVAAVIGPNGSGKTTLIKAILGLIPVRSGEIRVFGKHFHAVRDLVGYAPQRFDFDRSFPITVGEFMNLARHPHSPASRVAEKIKEVGLAAQTVRVQLGTLSGGQLQRVLIAQAILNNPQILILDEPASGIDIAGEATFQELIAHLNQEYGTTVLMISHDIAMVSRLVDNVICVNRQMLCYGPPKEALTARKIDELFGPAVELYEHPGHKRGDRAHGHEHGQRTDHEL